MDDSSYVFELVKTADALARKSRMDPGLYARTLLDVWQGAHRRRASDIRMLALVSALSPPTAAQMALFLRELERRVPPESRAS